MSSVIYGFAVFNGIDFARIHGFLDILIIWNYTIIMEIEIQATLYLMSLYLNAIFSYSFSYPFTILHYTLNVGYRFVTSVYFDKLRRHKTPNRLKYHLVKNVTGLGTWNKGPHSTSRKIYTVSILSIVKCSLTKVAWPNEGVPICRSTCLSIY